MTAILTADCVTKSFGTRRVLSSATLLAVSGELRVIFGRNGSGKSTLLKIAAGMIQPDGGSIRFADRAFLSTRFPVLAAAGLFYLPDHDLLSASFSIRRQLDMLSDRFDGIAPEEAAEHVGIAHVLDRRPHSLSGGELRRAEIAAAFVRRPRCVLADEPYRGVSPKDAEILTRAFRDLAAGGVAVVVTGHEVPTLLDAADHVTWCTSGTTYELGSPIAATRNDRFCREYLGTRMVR